MSMFDTFGKSSDTIGRKSNTLRKLERMKKTLRHEEPDRVGAVINRLGAHFLECAQAEIDAGAGLLDGFVIWGDVAYKKGMFFSPAYWRAYFKPCQQPLASRAPEEWWAGMEEVFHSD